MIMVGARQAFLITAYKDPSQLMRLIEKLKDFYVYVHIDKKSIDVFGEVIKAYKENPNVVIKSRYRVSWGSYNHLRSVVYLMNLARNNPYVKYIHILSGQDYPICPIRNVFSKFEDTKTVYMTCRLLLDTDDNVIMRYERLHLFAPFLDLRRGLYNKLDKHFSFCKKRIGGIKIKDLYKGMVWVSMPMEVCKYVCKYVCKGRGMLFYRALMFREIPEEVFFQTIIMGSKFKDNVVADNLRYTLWFEKNGAIPGVLDESDYEGIVNGNAVFARKIDSSISGKLIELIDQRG